VEEEERELKEFFIRSRIYNNLMRTARIEAGFESCADLARACGINNSVVCALEGLKRSPRSWVRIGFGGRYTDNGWSKYAEVISRAVKVLPEDLWPEEMWNAKAKPNEMELSFEEAAALIGQSTLLAIEDPADLYERRELAETLQQVMGSLTPRENRVLQMRFGIGERHGYSLEEVGQDFEVTKERIRQIEAKALRNLRHPSRSRRLRQFVGDVKLPKLSEVDPREAYLAGKINEEVKAKKIAAARIARTAREAPERLLALEKFKKEQEQERIARKEAKERRQRGLDKTACLEAKERKQRESSDRAQAEQERKVWEEERSAEQIALDWAQRWFLSLRRPLNPRECPHQTFTSAVENESVMKTMKFKCIDCGVRFKRSQVYVRELLAMSMNDRISMFILGVNQALADKAMKECANACSEGVREALGRIMEKTLQRIKSREELNG
jgi:RNA polymerase sigma factor (sigma-70 family)